MARNAQDEDHPENKSKVCNHWKEKQALLYCRADSAKLCISCDRQVHAANGIFSKHSRYYLCDVCRDQPASIFCASHQLLHCPNCDFDAHPPSLEAHQQNRRSLEPFSGCPSANELSSLFGFDDDKSLWFSDVDSINHFHESIFVCLLDCCEPDEQSNGSFPIQNSNMVSERMILILRVFSAGGPSLGDFGDFSDPSSISATVIGDLISALYFS
ncbi:zinc finger protein CONSTANS-LIKE 13-like [Aristolochia californica]|uniref:zinc finger protein CONSTANS-LIKE 13-like n=1 Tax=Aristolochia californica TaxID=171875 RepID=UPI0035DC7A38